MTAHCFTAPSRLAEVVAGERPGHRREWFSSLGTTVSDVARRWSLDLGPPYEPGGSCAWVAPARSPDFGEVVLKVAWRHTEAEHEADGLREWDGDGAVRLYRAEEVEPDSAALMLERASAGHELSARPEEEQDVVIAGLLNRLWRTPTPGLPFRPLQVMCDQWAREFMQERESDPLAADVDPGLVREGIALLRALPGSAERCVLLCTDLHAANVLAAEREPWLMIDPKPYVGDPHYDVVQHLYNCRDRLIADPVALSARLAELAGLDSDRLQLWLFARCIQESADHPELYEVACCLAP